MVCDAPHQAKLVMDAAVDEASSVQIAGSNRHDANIIWRSMIASQMEERRRVSVLVNQQERELGEIAGVNVQHRACPDHNPMSSPRCS
jgi:hypothetical protein